MNFHIWLQLSMLIIFDFTGCQVDDDDVRRSHEKMANLMRHDGVQRVVVAEMKNIDKLLKKNQLLVVYYWIDNNKESEKLSKKDTEFLEVVAQIFQNNPVTVATCEIMANQKFAVAAGVRYTGMMKVFNKGKVTTYSGQRSPDVFIPYLNKMMEIPVAVIKTKTEKKQFDANDLPKVVAYLNKNSKELKEFTEAALSYQPMVPFYVVHDVKLAKSVHLKKLNTVVIVKPYEKSTSFPAKKKLTTQNIVDFIEHNKKQRLTKMRLENLHDVWSIDMKGYLVPIFALPGTTEGQMFFSMAKSLAKSFQTNDNLTFVWIDPQPFPAMIEYWKQVFKIDPMVPAFGVVDVHTQSSVWYEKQEGVEYDLKFMKKWLNNVISSEIKLIPMTSYTPPEPKVINNEDEEMDEKDEL